MNRFDAGSFYEIREVGKGGEGTVFRATIKSFGRVAVKVYHSSSSVNHRELKNIYQYSHHPNIVRLLGFIENANLDGDRFSRRTGYVMEYMSNGSVHDAIHKTKMDYSLDTAYSWICQTSRAVLYLHENHLIHRDLKPRNLLLCDDLKNVKICDFGLTRDCKEESTLTAGIGSLRYMAPEMIRAGNGSKYDKSVDVYSLGITIWEILTKRVPYDHVPHLVTPEFALCEAVVNGVRPETPANLQWDVQFIIENTWMINTSARIEIEQILNFFTAKLCKDDSDEMQGESSETDDSEDEETITETATVPRDPESVEPENPIDYVTWLATILRQTTKSGIAPKMSGKDGAKDTQTGLQVAAGYHPENQRTGNNSSVVTPVAPVSVTSSHSDPTVVNSLPQETRKEVYFEDSKETRNTRPMTRNTEELSRNPLTIADRVRLFAKSIEETRDPKETKAWEVKVSPHTRYSKSRHYWAAPIRLETIAIAPSVGQMNLGFDLEERWSQFFSCFVLFVTKVADPSPAQKSELRVEDQIYRVNGKPMEMMDDYEKREFKHVIRNWTYPYPLVLAVKRA